MIRAFIGGLAFASALFAPPWLPLVGAGLLTVRYRAWEVLVLGALIDLLYVPPGGFFGIPIPATLTAFILLVGFEPIRRKLLV
mgnify:CR=1 FL=1